MKRVGLFIACLLLLVSGLSFWYYTTYRHGPATLAAKLWDLAGKSHRTAPSADSSEDVASRNPLEEVAGLAIKGIDLFQGDNGIELWRLKASWAHLNQDGDTINVDSPHVRYALGDHSTGNPEDDILEVEGRKGRITDNQRFLSLWDDVVVTRFDDRLTGPLMNYNATTRIMSFPAGAKLESPRASGTAGVFTWDLAQNELQGTEGVVVVLKPRLLPEDTSSKTGAAQTQPKPPAAAMQQSNSSSSQPGKKYHE